MFKQLKRKRAIKEALKHTDNFEKTLSILGYVIVDKEKLRNLCKLATKV